MTMRRARAQGGFTLLEVVISLTIMTVVLQTTVSSTLVMTRSSDFGIEGTRVTAHAQQVMSKLKQELRSCASGNDASGNPYVTTTGTTGNMTLTFRRIAQFGTTGQELVPVYTSPIKVYRNNNRQLVREQGGKTVVLMSEVDLFDCKIDLLNRIYLGVATSAGGGASDGTTVRAFHEMRVAPQR
jgi:prepilin-type N-terminal cleavage/methylation domain-containing protein